MTVNTTQITAGPYTGNGVANTFAFGFRIEDNSQITVFKTLISGDVLTLNLNTDYTVSGVGSDAGGSISLVVAPPATGELIFIRSNFQQTQNTSFDSQGGFFPEVHEAAFDKLTFLVQQMSDGLTKSLRFPESYSGSASTVLPAPEASQLLGWSADGNNLENVRIEAGVISGNLVNSVTTLRLLTPVVGDVASTKGWHTNQLGVGSATYDAVSGITTDLHGDQASATPNVYWKLRRGKTVSAEKLGALVGIDSTSAIQSGLDYYELTGGGEILIGPKFNVTNLRIASFCALKGIKRQISGLNQIANSEAHVIQSKSLQTVRVRVSRMTIKGDRDNSSTGSGVFMECAITSQSADDSTRHNFEDLEIRECADDGLVVKATTGFISPGWTFRDIDTKRNKGVGIRLFRATDGRAFNVVSAGNIGGGIVMKDSSSTHWLGCKTFFNGENNPSSSGWDINNSHRGSLISCEAQEDYYVGFKITGCNSIGGNILADANGREATPGVGVILDDITRFSVNIRSSSFHVPTWQSVAVRMTDVINSNFVITNNPIVPTELTLVSGNNNVILTLTDLVAHIDNNTLTYEHDYSEGVWTPTITFSTPGDLSTTYTTQVGTWTRKGDDITLRCTIETSTFVHTTSSGNLEISGIPFMCSSTPGLSLVGSYAGSNAGDDQSGLVSITPFISNGNNTIRLYASRTSGPPATLQAGSTQSGENIEMHISINYTV